jgi:hypothetical protein
MANLDRAWSQWVALNRTDRAKFLTLLREAYAREREMVLRRRNGGGAPNGARISRLADLSLSEADLMRARGADVGI